MISAIVKSSGLSMSSPSMRSTTARSEAAPERARENEKCAGFDIDRLYGLRAGDVVQRIVERPAFEPGEGLDLLGAERRIVLPRPHVPQGVRHGLRADERRGGVRQHVEVGLDVGRARSSCRGRGRGCGAGNARFGAGIRRCVRRCNRRTPRRSPRCRRASAGYGTSAVRRPAGGGFCPLPAGC